MSTAVAVHPEVVAGDPATLRWVVPAGLVEPGSVRGAPGRLGDLVSSGRVTDVTAEHAAIWLTLAEGSWAEHGDAVRSALGEALGRPGDWVVDTGPVAARAALRRITLDVLAGPVGDYVRSHGGRLDVVDVADGVVVLSLDGTCEHCPAAGLTLHARVETAVRARWPALVGVREQGSDVDARSALSRWLRLG